MSITSQLLRAVKGPALHEESCVALQPVKHHLLWNGVAVAEYWYFIAMNNIPARASLVNTSFWEFKKVRNIIFSYYI